MDEDMMSSKLEKLRATQMAGSPLKTVGDQNLETSLNLSTKWTHKFKMPNRIHPIQTRPIEAIANLQAQIEKKPIFTIRSLVAPAATKKVFVKPRILPKMVDSRPASIIALYF